MEEVPRRTSLCTPCVPLFCTSFAKGGNRRAFTLPGEGGGIISIVLWTLRPVHIRCRDRGKFAGGIVRYPVIPENIGAIGIARPYSGRKKAHKHKLFALVNARMALGQTASCPRVNRAKKFMCSPRNTGNINFSLWLTGGIVPRLSGPFKKVYVFKVLCAFFLARPYSAIGGLERLGHCASSRAVWATKPAKPSQRKAEFASRFAKKAYSDSVKRHLRGRHLSVLNLKFDFISDGVCTCEEQIALSLKRHLFPHGGQESPRLFGFVFRPLPPHL